MLIVTSMPPPRLNSNSSGIPNVAVLNVDATSNFTNAKRPWSNANAAMPNSNGNGNYDGNIKPAHRLIVFFEK